MVGVAQLGWVGPALSDVSAGVTIAIFAALILIELAGPILSDRKAPA